MMTATDGGTGGGEHHSRLIRQLCALLVTIVSPSASPRSSPSQAPQAMSPAAAASMLLGASMALMLCGSVTFAIGLLLMPWVAGLALLFGFAGAVSTLSSGVFGKPSAPPPLPLPLPASPSASACKDERLMLTDRPRFFGYNSLPTAAY